jgi:hypothetical protein
MALPLSEADAQTPKADPCAPLRQTERVRRLGGPRLLPVRWQLDGEGRRHARAGRQRRQVRRLQDFHRGMARGIQARCSVITHESRRADELSAAVQSRRARQLAQEQRLRELVAKDPDITRDAMAAPARAVFGRFEKHDEPTWNPGSGWEGVLTFTIRQRRELERIAMHRADEQSRAEFKREAPAKRGAHEKAPSPDRVAKWPRIRELHAQGLTDKRISEEVGLTPNAVTWARRKMGLRTNAKPSGRWPETDVFR